MDICVSYGKDQVFELESQAHFTLVNAPGAEVSPIQDVDKTVRKLLARPLGLPPLARCLVTFDQVILVLKRGTPRGSEILAAVAKYLLPILAKEGRLTVLRTELDEEMGRGDPRPYLPANEREFVEVATHHAELREQFALLARLQDGRPLRLHRALVDADVVIPVGWSQAGNAWRSYVASWLAFPAFSDRMSQLAHWRETVRSAKLRLSLRQRVRRRVRQMGVEANWHLGMQFAIEAVPGPSDSLLQVVAGRRDVVEAVAHESYRKWWCPTVDHKADLVIAGVDHDPCHTPWENLAQAAWSAARLVRRGGRIIFLTDWSKCPASPAINVSSLAEVSGIWSWSEFLQQHGDRGLPFWLLARVRRHANLCLWTAEPLADESLGGWRDRLFLETASGPGVIRRVTNGVNSCIVFAHASLAWPKIVRKKPGCEEDSQGNV
ncbi:MAG: hypothetical protein ACUVQG_14825 [Thermogutta sp.]